MRLGVKVFGDDFPMLDDFKSISQIQPSFEGFGQCMARYFNVFAVHQMVILNT